MANKCLIVLSVVLSVITIVLIFDPKARRVEEVKAARDYSGQYQFTNPILDYENVRMEGSSLFHERITSKIHELEKKHGLSFHSIYYRDLDNGQWIGVHEKEQFTTASLIKLPVLISLLRESEVNPSILSEKVMIREEDKESVIIQDFKPQKELVVGESYTMLELAERMIQESDNTALKIVTEHINEKYRTGIFEAIGVAFSLDNEDIMVRVKDYAGFFRVLFNASYLNRENSELALSILSKTNFDLGIVSGVSKGITVAHKFGERSNYIDNKLVSKQLHDCGIVYYPQKPYILCVMTRGSNFEDQAAFIREVSRLFFQEVEKSI
jgi:beta-lactamase class A